MRPKDKRFKIKVIILSAVTGVILLAVLFWRGNFNFLTGKQASSQTPFVQDNTSVNPSPSEDLSPAPNPAALVLYEQGLDLYYEKNFSEALNLFNKALAIDPACYQALNAKGATLAFQGKYDEGLTLIKQALALKPDFVYGHFNLGLANELAGRWDPAISAYLQAIQLDNKDVWSYYGIASIYGRFGNTEKVLEYLEQAININPEVKEDAREEHDFDPVRQDPRFQELVRKTTP